MNKRILGTRGFQNSPSLSKVLLVALGLCALLSNHAFGNWEVLESSNDHLGRSNLEFQLDKKANQWKVVLTEGAVKTKIKQGAGAPATAWIEWSPDDKAVLVNPHLSKSFVWFVASKSVVDIESILEKGGVTEKIDTIYADWLSSNRLHLTVWHGGNETGENWSLDLKRMLAVRLTTNPRSESIQEKMCWSSKCDNNAAFEKATPDGEARMLYILVNRLPTPIMFDGRYITVSWSDDCKSLIVNDHGGSNFAETYLIPDIERLQGSSEGDPSKVVGMRNFVNDLYAHLPEYKWLQDFDHFYFDAVWLNDKEAVVSVSGHTSLGQGKNRSLKSLYFYWHLDGSLNLMSKEVFD